MYFVHHAFMYNTPTPAHHFPFSCYIIQSFGFIFPYPETDNRHTPYENMHTNLQTRKSFTYYSYIVRFLAFAYGIKFNIKCLPKRFMFYDRDKVFGGKTCFSFSVFSSFLLLISFIFPCFYFLFAVKLKWLIDEMGISFGVFYFSLLPIFQTVLQRLIEEVIRFVLIQFSPYTFQFLEMMTALIFPRILLYGLSIL